MSLRSPLYIEQLHIIQFLPNIVVASAPLKN